ncbi:hypothetical protein [Lysobacter gummosus]|uniref:hypothetical protein n=1 Tax=Lysobacter gummosus TaxID=262324 RepID=UPI003635246D
MAPRPQIGRRERTGWRNFRQTAFFVGSRKPRPSQKGPEIRRFWRPGPGERWCRYGKRSVSEKMEHAKDPIQEGIASGSRAVSEYPTPASA